MKPEAISDQKRLVRGLHWHRVRYFLRVRDAAHHKAWKLLIIAGPSPHEEVNCIKSIMQRAHITAIDINERNVLAAIDAGVDEAYQLNIGDWVHARRGNGPYDYLPPAPFDELVGAEVENRFDAICLDLTGPADDWLKRVIQVWTKALKPRGVMIVTLSYGRDVVERIAEEWRREINGDRRHIYDDPIGHLDQMPDPLAMRVWYVLRTSCRHLDSCLQYRGARMPMISCLTVKGAPNLPPANYASIEKSDYELAVAAEDLGSVFACPVERLTELRQKNSRRIAAQKAVQTRRARQKALGAQPRLLLEAPKDAAE